MVLGILVLFFACAAMCFNPEGDWSNLGIAVLLAVVLPVFGVICCVLALTLIARRTTPEHRVFAWSAFTAALLLGCPFTNIPLAVGSSRSAALVLEPFNDIDLPEWPFKVKRHPATPGAQPPPLQAAGPRLSPPQIPPPPDPVVVARTIARQYETLSRQFTRPQKVVRAANGMLVLEDQKILRLYGVHVSYENSVDLSNLTSGHLVARQVMIRLPDRQTFTKTYTPVGDGFGTIPAYVYVDGVLLNARYRTTPGSLNDFGEYEKAPTPVR